MTHSVPHSLSETYSEALQEFGWRALGDPEARRLHFPVRPSLAIPGAEAFRAYAQIFRRGDETLLALDCSAPDAPNNPDDAPDALFQNFLDLSALERLALWSLGRQARADLLLCATLQGVRLLDGALEVPLGAAPPEPDGRQARHCLRVLEGARPRPLPDIERLSADLACWIDLVGGKMGRVLHFPRSDMERLARQMLLGLRLIAAAPLGETPGLGTLGLAMSETDEDAGEMRLSWQAPAPADLIEHLLARSYAFAPTGAGAFQPFERSALCKRVAALDADTTGPLQSVLRLAAAKLRAPVLARVLMPGDDGRHASWRLALTEPLKIEEAIDAEDLRVARPLTLDLSECGVERVLEAVEGLALYAARQNRNLTRAGGRQLDIFESERPEGACVLEDPFDWLCRSALRLRVAEAYRESLAFIVAAHVADLRAAPAFADSPAGALRSLGALFSDSV